MRGLASRLPRSQRLRAQALFVLGGDRIWRRSDSTGGFPRRRIGEHSVGTLRRLGRRGSTRATGDAESDAEQAPSVGRSVGRSNDQDRIAAVMVSAIGCGAGSCSPFTHHKQMRRHVRPASRGKWLARSPRRSQRPRSACWASVPPSRSRREGGPLPPNPPPVTHGIRSVGREGPKPHRLVHATRQTRSRSPRTLFTHNTPPGILTLLAAPDLSDNKAGSRGGVIHHNPGVFVSESQSNR